MTEGMQGSEKFADIEKIATSIVKTIDAGQDVI